MPRRQLQSKRILITGASSGIGKGLALEAANRGAQLVLNGRNQERLDAVAQTIRAIGQPVVLAPGDITEEQTRHRILQMAEQHFGGLDILVNNAGVGATGHFQYATAERLRTIFETNFFAPAELTRLAIPLLKSGRDPAIVFINSVAGRRAIPSRVEYSASKFALMGFSEALRAELIKDAIEVTVINPGLTESAFEDHMIENKARHSLHSQRSMTANACAALAWSAVERRSFEVTFTFQGKMLVLLSRLFPRFIDRKMAGFVRKLYAKEMAEAKAELSPHAGAAAAHA